MFFEIGGNFMKINFKANFFLSILAVNSEENRDMLRKEGEKNDRKIMFFHMKYITE